jgi:hypothetical protein
VTSADVLDGSLKVRLDFDAAPVGDIIPDRSPGGVHPGTNIGATWVAGEAGRQGVMNLDGFVPSLITVAAAPDLNSTVGTIAFWMKSTEVTANPNANAIIFDRRTAGGEVIYQDATGHLTNQAQQASGGAANSQTSAANVTDGLWHHIAYVYDQSVSGYAAIYVDGVLDTSAANGPLSEQAEVTGRERANEFSSKANLTDDRWHHVAYVYDQTARGFVAFYVDGLLDGSRNNARSWYWVPDQIIELGKSHDAWWSAYTGFLDDFRIYNRVLTASEIADLAGVAIAPTLSVTLAGRNLTLTWTQAGYVLQENRDLGNAAGWTNVAGGDASPVTVTIAVTGASFYRVIKP